VAAVCLAYVAFFAYSPLSSPLLSFVLPMMILSNPLHDIDYELMINTCEKLGIIPSALRPVFFLSTMWQQLLFFLPTLPSALLSCVLPMMKLSKSI
jgi:hypothetical protein